MIGAGTAMILLTLLGVAFMRGRGLEARRWFLRIAVGAAVLPVVANWTGWIFTEIGRQPWVVYGLLETNVAGSPEVGTASVLITLIGFSLLYGVLAGVGGWIAVKEIRRGPEPPAESDGPDGPTPGDGRERDLVLAY